MEESKRKKDESLVGSSVEDLGNGDDLMVEVLGSEVYVCGDNGVDETTRVVGNEGSLVVSEPVEIKNVEEVDFEMESVELEGGVNVEEEVRCLETENCVGETLSGLEEEERGEREIGNGGSEVRVVVELESEVTVLTEVVAVSEPGEPLSLKQEDERMEVEVRVSEAEQVAFDGGNESVVVSDREIPGDLKSEEDRLEDLEVKEETSIVQEVFESQQEASGEVTEKDTISLHHHSQVVGSEGTLSDNCISDSVNEGADNSHPETTERSIETDNKVTDYVDTFPMETDEVMISETELLEQHLGTDQKPENEGCLNEDQVTASDEIGLHGERGSVVFEEVADGDELPNTVGEKIASCESPEPGSSSSRQNPSYELPPESEDVLSMPDLVWGKVKSHPWWPGQIFDFTEASEKAMKHQKKDCLLVAYFGDRTFAWNEESTLKSFRAHFSQMVDQCNGETFHKAVGCALEEVSRRVELGLACSCVPKDSFENVRVQVVENAGIRSESSIREGVDDSVGVSFFHADKLIDYIRALARCSMGTSDDLGLTVAKAQLLSFGRFKGNSSLPEFQFCGELMENETAGSQSQDIHPGYISEPFKDNGEASLSQEMVKANKKSSLKRKHNLRDGIYSKVKEKSLSELMGGGGLDYPDDDHVSGKRRRNVDNHRDDMPTPDGRKPVSLAKVIAPPKQSFKIGECIRRVASQMTGSPSVKGNAERAQKVDGTGDRPADGNDTSLQDPEGRAIEPTDYSSLDELLIQLQLIARDPIKEYNFSNVIVNFFSDFRNSVIEGHQLSEAELAMVVVDKASSKRKKVSPETFEFDDLNDTYWTDRVIQNGVEEQPLPRKSRKKDNNQQLAVVLTPQSEKASGEGRRQYKKRYSNGNHHTSTPEKPPGYISENAPTELLMNFSEVRSLPSESNLIRMFRRFGPLKEAETEVDTENSRARVVFKKCSDAEVAFNSAGKFNIFGPILVNYQLNYIPTIHFKPVPYVVTLDHEEQLDLSAHDHTMQLDLSTHEHEMQLDLVAHDHDMQLDLSVLGEFEVDLV